MIIGYIEYNRFSSGIKCRYVFNTLSNFLVFCEKYAYDFIVIVELTGIKGSEVCYDGSFQILDVTSEKILK